MAIETKTAHKTPYDEAATCLVFTFKQAHKSYISTNEIDKAMLALQSHTCIETTHTSIRTMETFLASAVFYLSISKQQPSEG